MKGKRETRKVVALRGGNMVQPEQRSGWTGHSITGSDYVELASTGSSMNQEDSGPTRCTPLGW